MEMPHHAIRYGLERPLGLTSGAYVCKEFLASGFFIIYRKLSSLILREQNG